MILLGKSLGHEFMVGQGEDAFSAVLDLASTRERGVNTFSMMRPIVQGWQMVVALWRYC